MEIPGPSFHALLNATSAGCLALGFAAIRSKKIAVHLTCMVLALAASLTFLASYLVYHFRVGSIPFEDTGAARVAYFAVLISHSILAVALLPMAGATLYRAARRQFVRHRGVARWALPMWFYVSATGILVYLMRDV